MGKILYGDAGTEIVFDDRALDHIQIVIAAKLRRNESFFFSWTDDVSVGSGRTSIWLDAAISLYFKYRGGGPSSINREWIELLMRSANSAHGMQFLNEPDPPG